MSAPKPKRKKSDSIELSDPELREIEEMNSSNDLKDIEGNDEDVDLDALEAELLAGESHDGPKVHDKSQVSLTDIEKEFHGIEFFFGSSLRFKGFFSKT